MDWTCRLVWLCAISSYVICSVFGADPIYTPQEITDSAGNHADNNSVINWAALPSGDSYKTSSSSYNPGGLEAYYNLVTSFINTVFANGFPEKLITKLASGDTSYITSNYSEFIPNFIGYVICIALGLLFIFIFPLVGCCFCCCRLCGNCGGRMLQKQKDANKMCKKYMFGLVLFLFITLTVVGMVCVYVNNDQTTTAINTVGDSASNNIDDISTFLNNTIDQTKHVAVTDIDFLTQALTRDIDNIDYLVGLPLREEIDTNTNMSNIFTTAYALESDIQAMFTAFDDVDRDYTYLLNNLTALETALMDVKDNLTAIFTACGTTLCPEASRPGYDSLNLGFNSSTLPNITDQKTSISSAQGQNLTQLIADAETEFQNIPETVKNESASTTDSLKNDLGDLNTTISPVLDSITDIQNTVNVEEYKTKAQEYTDLASEYNKYRWYGGIALSCIVLLVVILLFMGLMFGLCGSGGGVDPTHRGCLSHTGGNLLMAAVGFVFIFSPLMMLLTTLTFMVGAPLEKFGCQQISDISHLETFVDGTINDALAGEGKYFLGNALYGNDTIELTFSGMLRDCKDGESAYIAFKLSSKFDIDDVLNYSKSIDIDGQIDNLNVDFSTIDVYPSSLKTQLSDLNTAVDIDYTQFYDELNKNASEIDLTALAKEISDYADNVVNDAIIKPQLNAQASILTSINNNELVDTNTAKTNLNTSVAAMENVSSQIPIKVGSLNSSLLDAEDYIQNQGSTVIKGHLTTYANRMLSMADSFVTYVKSALQDSIGICTPIWNLYNSLVVISVCGYVIDTVNGFWFSLGWCVFFFIPSIIIAVKLARYFRRMQYSEHYDSSTTLNNDTTAKQRHCPVVRNVETPSPPEFGSSEQTPVLPFTQVDTVNAKPAFSLRKNKVGHSDGVRGSLEQWTEDTAATAPPAGRLEPTAPTEDLFTTNLPLEQPYIPQADMTNDVRQAEEASEERRLVRDESRNEQPINEQQQGQGNDMIESKVPDSLEPNVIGNLNNEDAGGTETKANDSQTVEQNKYVSPSNIQGGSELTSSPSGLQTQEVQPDSEIKDNEHPSVPSQDQLYPPLPSDDKSSFGQSFDPVSIDYTQTEDPRKSEW